MALIANTHRDPKKSRALRPSYFDPFVRVRSTPIPKTDIGVLKTVFIDKTIPKEVLPT